MLKLHNASNKEKVEIASPKNYSLFGRDEVSIESLARINRLKDQNYKNSSLFRTILNHTIHKIIINYNKINTIQIAPRITSILLAVLNYFAGIILEFIRIKTLLTKMVLRINYLFLPDSGIYSLNEQRESS